MTNYIRQQREKRRWTREQLAAKAGTSVSQITKLERGERKLTQEWLERLSSVLEVHPIALLSAWTIDVIGQVRDDGAIIFEEDGGTPTVAEVESPSHAAKSVVAVEVPGDDLAGFADAGSILFFDWDYPWFGPALNLGKMSAVWCEDGRLLVRRVFPGTSQDRWTIVTAGGRAEYDVQLKQAIPITWVRMPPPHNGDDV